MDLENSPIYAALLGGTLLTVQILLMLSVGIYRTKSKKGVGVDGDTKLERLVRRHGNLAENAAFFILVLALYELFFGQTALALTTACVFFAARVLHIFGFASNSGSHLVDVNGSGAKFALMRALGAGLTALSSLALGIAIVLGVVRIL